MTTTTITGPCGKLASSFGSSSFPFSLFTTYFSFLLGILSSFFKFFFLLSHFLFICKMFYYYFPIKKHFLLHAHNSIDDAHTLFFIFLMSFIFDYISPCYKSCFLFLIFVFLSFLFVSMYDTYISPLPSPSSDCCQS